MCILILYESEEWSTYALREDIEKLGVPAELVCTEQDISEEKLAGCPLVVNRVFASAQFRGHHRSLAQMPRILEFLKEKEIPMVNPYQAHAYEVSKALSTRVLRERGIAVPEVYGTFHKQELFRALLKYPCIIKPDCGGRTNATFIVRERRELENAVGEAPDIEYIAEEYVEPQYGYVTRIEVIGGECRLILRRSLAGNGLSAYRLGSTYREYPDCAAAIQETAVRAMEILEIEAGSMDIIENDTGFYIIDVNAVSNASEENTEMFRFDLMLETAKYVVEKYHQLYADKNTVRRIEEKE